MFYTEKFGESMKKDRVTRFEIHLNRKDMNSGRFKIAFLSDLHNCKWDAKNDRLVDLILNEKADLVLCGGDMTVAHPGACDDEALSLIRRVSNEQKVYYALGNHEYRLRLYPETYGDRYEKYIESLMKMNVCVLDNKKEDVFAGNIPVSIYGLSIERRFYKRFSAEKMLTGYIDSMIGKPDDKMINILLAHTPKYMETYMRWGADLSFSGHYHGGVMRIGKNMGLISPDPSFFPYNAHGYFERENRFEIISAGLGEHTIPVRLNNPRELVVAEVFINR